MTPEQKITALNAVWPHAKDLDEAIRLAEKYLAYVYGEAPEQPAISAD